MIAVCLASTSRQTAVFYAMLLLLLAVPAVQAASQDAVEGTGAAAALLELAADGSVDEASSAVKPAPMRSHCKDASGKPPKMPRAPRLSGLVQVGDARSALIIFEDGSSGWMRLGWETLYWKLTGITDRQVVLSWCGRDIFVKFGEQAVADLPPTEVYLPSTIEGTKDFGSDRADLQRAFTHGQAR